MKPRAGHVPGANCAEMAPAGGEQVPAFPPLGEGDEACVHSAEPGIARATRSEVPAAPLVTFPAIEGSPAPSPGSARYRLSASRPRVAALTPCRSAVRWSFRRSCASPRSPIPRSRFRSP
jgi:hypothetical protein